MILAGVKYAEGMGRVLGETPDGEEGLGKEQEPRSMEQDHRQESA